ncbi:Nicotinamidase (plasmid) [Euzebya pacifica]|uniref:nicotinamidase n=1 Tax=Euzebya pacifica TaxID=1608957 RepID=A0A346Y6P9_9ACTN|nr:isochorismatase family protein [Euzebya pacifica]AXV10146.1 Nicotinamidase [Euzebya pacifica]
MTRALIIVDTQVDFVEGGRLAVDGGREAATAITRYLAAESGRYVAIAATKDWHTPDTHNHFPATADDPIDIANGIWPVHCMAGTAGSEFTPELRLPDGTPTFLKGQTDASYTGFDGILAADTPWGESGTLLGDWLAVRGITAVDVVGIAYDVCVAATAISAANAGLAATVIRPLTAAIGGEVTTAAEADMAAAGVTICNTTPGDVSDDLDPVALAAQVNPLHVVSVAVMLRESDGELVHVELGIDPGNGNIRTEYLYGDDGRVDLRGLRDAVVMTADADYLADGRVEYVWVRPTDGALMR